MTAPIDTLPHSLPEALAETGFDADSVLSRKPLVPTLIYWGLHALCGAALFVGVSSGDLLLAATTFWVRLFAITGGYRLWTASDTEIEGVDVEMPLVHTAEIGVRFEM